MEYGFVTPTISMSMIVPHRHRIVDDARSANDMSESHCATTPAMAARLSTSAMFVCWAVWYGIRRVEELQPRCEDSCTQLHWSAILESIDGLRCVCRGEHAVTPKSHSCHATFLADTYFISPNLVLVRSKDAGNREVGISRVSRWHTSDGALAEVIRQGGAEALLRALPGAQPESRVAVLEVLTKAASLSEGRACLIANKAAARASAGCASIGEGAPADVSTRCQELAGTLAEALRAP